MLIWALTLAGLLAPQDDAIQVKTNDALGSPQTRLSVTAGAASTLKAFVDLDMQSKKVRNLADGVDVRDGINLGQLTAILGSTTGPFIQFAPGVAQTTTTAVSPLIYLNENGAGTPSLLQIQVGGVDKFAVSNGGAVTSGLWQAGTIGTLYGGTGVTAIGSAGSVAYSNGSVYAFTGVGTSGSGVLVSGGSGIPTWSNSISGNLTTQWGVTTTSTSAGSRGVSGISSQTATSGTGWGNSGSTSFAGVYGAGGNTGAQYSAGVHGYQVGSGSNAGGVVGSYSGTIWGGLGYSDSASQRWAGYFNGPVYLSAASATYGIASFNTSASGAAILGITDATSGGPVGWSTLGGGYGIMGGTSGQTWQAGVAGFTGGAPANNTASVVGVSVVGAEGTGTWGALGYRDGAATTWAGFFSGDAKVTGHLHLSNRLWFDNQGNTNVVMRRWIGAVPGSGTTTVYSDTVLSIGINSAGRIVFKPNVGYDGWWDYSSFGVNSNTQGAELDPFSSTGMRFRSDDVLTAADSWYDCSFALGADFGASLTATLDKEDVTTYGTYLIRAHRTSSSAVSVAIEAFSP